MASDTWRINRSGVRCRASGYRHRLCHRSRTSRILRCALRSQGNERAAYWHDNPKAEAILLIGTAVILTVLVFMGQRVWANIYFADRPENPLVVEVVGQQFNWNFRYPGADGAFGKIEPKFITGTDPFGLDPADPAGKDDVISIGELHVINNRPALFRLRSNDVIHSFFLPNYRVKQDTVPGMQIEIWMTPTTDNFTRNSFEVACAELCGMGHYKMKGLDDGRSE